MPSWMMLFAPRCVFSTAKVEIFKLEQMFDRDFLAGIAESVIQKEEEHSHFEETGMKLHHFDFDILSIDEPQFSSGRSGDYYKFNFEYQITLLDDAGLKSDEDDVRVFRRSVRISTEGKLTGVGGRSEIFD